MKLCPRDPSHGLMFQREDRDRNGATAEAGGVENELGWAGSGLGTTLHFQDLTPDSPVELADVLERRQRRSADYEVCAQIASTRKVSLVVPLSLNMSTPQPMPAASMSTASSTIRRSLPNVTITPPPRGFVPVGQVANPNPLVPKGTETGLPNTRA